MSRTAAQEAAETVSFSDLSKRPAAVAEKAARLGYVRITHRDAPDMVLATAALVRNATESLTTASRLIRAVSRSEAAADLVLDALDEVFPWARHLDDAERHTFVNELVGALSDDAELGTRDAVHRVVVSWRATARIYADPEQRKDALRPLTEDFGPVEMDSR